MSDFPSIAAAIQSLRTANEILKGLRAAESGIERAELKLKIAELAESLSDARMAVLDAQTEIETLRARVRELEGVSDLRSQLELRGNVFYRQEGAKESGPYCPSCFETKGKLIPLTPLGPSFRFAGNYRCPNCKGVL